MSKVEAYQIFAESFAGADVYYKEAWEVYYFSLLGKCFGLLTDEKITLKGLPSTNIKLREKYSDVKEGYHMNKQHWITIPLDTKQLSDNEIKDLIKTSYTLVYKNLSKADKLVVDEMSTDFKK